MIYRARPVGNRAGPGTYALKTCVPSQHGSDIAVSMLRREGVVAQSVNSPHLTSMLAVHTDGPAPHFVLPFLEGIPLDKLLNWTVANRATLLPITVALSIARQTAEALSALHAEGWLHGRVRPGHIVVSPQGHATLIDLTEARRIGTAECEIDGSIISMSQYASPERFMNHGRLSAASDVYSLGVTLYEALTGQAPFAATDAKQWEKRHLQQAPTEIRQLRPDISREASQLVRRMLAKESLRRPSANEVVRWLAELEIEALAA